MFVSFNCEGMIHYLSENTVVFARFGDHVVVAGTCPVNGDRKVIHGTAGGYRKLTLDQVIAELNQRESTAGGNSMPQ